MRELGKREDLRERFSFGVGLINVLRLHNSNVLRKRMRFNWSYDIHENILDLS